MAFRVPLLQDTRASNRGDTAIRRNGEGISISADRGESRRFENFESKDADEWLASALTRPPREISRASNRTREYISEVVLSRLSDKSDGEKERERGGTRERKRGGGKKGWESEREGGRERRKKGEKGTVAREREGGRRARERERARGGGRV